MIAEISERSASEKLQFINLELFIKDLERRQLEKFSFSKVNPDKSNLFSGFSIIHSFGANIIQSDEIMHGKISNINHDEKGIFRNIPNPFKAVRYHSLIIDEKSLSDDFEISARSESGTIQGIRHKKLSLEGVQFHPESIETEYGKEILNNFLEIK